MICCALARSGQSNSRPKNKYRIGLGSLWDSFAEKILAKISVKNCTPAIDSSSLRSNVFYSSFNSYSNFLLQGVIALEQLPGDEVSDSGSMSQYPDTEKV
jgi:hypothetical protein